MEQKENVAMKKENYKALLPIGVFLVLYLGLGILFEYVLKKYIQYRGLPLQKTLQEGIAIKIKHDRDWYRRKNFFKKFKSFIK